MADGATRRGAGALVRGDRPQHDLTDEVTGATAAGIGGATLGAAAGPVGAVVGGAIGAVVGAVAGGAARAVVDVPGTDDTRGLRGGPLTGEEAPLDHAVEIGSPDTLDPA